MFKTIESIRQYAKSWLLPGPQEFEVTKIQDALLAHLFLSYNLSKVQAIATTERNIKNTEIAFREAFSVRQLLNLLIATATGKANEILEVQLYLTDKVENLLANLQKYIPINNPDIQSNDSFSQNHVHHLLVGREKINKVVKISAHNLASYLMNRYNISPEVARITQLANTETSIYILGTVVDNIPRRLFFFAGNLDGKPQPITIPLQTQKRSIRIGTLSPFPAQLLNRD